MPYLIHLRLPFQILLSPIFLWGFLMADGQPSARFFIAYVAFHIFGYAGGTAFNSYYDRDDGPIGGLAAPPPIPDGLLAFSLAWQLIGFVLAVLVNQAFALIYALMFWLSVAYSHPVTRWKGKAPFALLTVALGQGVLACLGGWAAARNEIFSAASFTGTLAVGAVTLITTGFYPLTQIYQMDADARRGDTTVAIALGAQRSFHFALTLLSLGALAAFALIAMRYALIEAMALGTFIIGLMTVLRRWGQRFDQRAIMYNFKMIMGIYAATSIGFMAWIAWHLFW